MLHITNGDSAADIMRAAGIAGEILPWRDVLHDGPTPAGLTLDEMTEVRAKFIADSGWSALDDALAQFRQRDAKVAQFRDHEEVILWFEHDLYDQLQLLQLLDFFSKRDMGGTRLTLICIDEYLGTLSPARMAALQGTQQPVTTGQLRLGERAWSAYCSPEPGRWEALLREDTSFLRFLAGAVLRHLEQYPALANGLSRTEAQLLQTLQPGAAKRWPLFEGVQRTEERRFMGDSSFWMVLDAMLASQPPLLTMDGEAVALAPTGERVLRGDMDWVGLNGIDKWLGGVRLTTNRYWRWDGAREQLVRQGNQ
jgi:hypothetical protein